MPQPGADSKPALAGSIAATAMALAVTLTGCVTTPVAPVDIGGSRADATVVMGATASSPADVTGSRDCTWWPYAIHGRTGGLPSNTRGRNPVS